MDAAGTSSQAARHETGATAATVPHRAPVAPQPGIARRKHNRLGYGGCGGAAFLLPQCGEVDCQRRDAILIDVNKKPGDGGVGLLQRPDDADESGDDLGDRRRTAQRDDPKHGDHPVAPQPCVPAQRERQRSASVEIALANGKNWSHDQKAHALGPLVYLCLTALASRVTQFRVENY